jgi:hypothetical protein
VKEYKEAAKGAGLDFVVFLENFEELNKEKWLKLVKECKELSDDGIKLIAGYSIRNNIGNYVMSYSEDGYWPDEEEYFLTGKKKELLNIQPEESPGIYTGYNAKSAFRFYLNHVYNGLRNIGHYNWKNSGKATPMRSQRICSLAGLRYYKGGKLVEDMLPEYLITLQSQMPPTPVSVNEVYSPEELVGEVEGGNALTYAEARSLNLLMEDALRWSRTFDGMNVFVSDGPIIHKWPACYRPMTFGGEEFVTLPSFRETPLHVSSGNGLKDVKIFDGTNLFRYFNVGGEKELNLNLLLDATVLKNLVVVAEDIKGGRAVSFALRMHKYDTRVVSYCSDHVNDAFAVRSFHGPGSLPVCIAADLPLDIAGYTWDGGPPARLQLVEFPSARPCLITDKGIENGSRFDQYPITEAMDEGIVAVASVQNVLFTTNVKAVVNPWHTFGPAGDKPRLMEFTQHFREYFPPNSGPGENDNVIRSMRYGVMPCIFRNEIVFKDDVLIKDLLLMASAASKRSSVCVVVGRKGGAVEKEIKADELKKTETIKVADGDWIGFYSSNEVACSHILVVRGEPLIVEVGNPGNSGWVRIKGEVAGKEFKRDEKYEYEIISLNTSLNIDVKNRDTISFMAKAMYEPEGLEVKRGKRVGSGGLIEVEAEGYAVELRVPDQTTNLDLTLGLKVNGLNRNWSAGLFQKAGYVLGMYGGGENRYRAVGIDLSGSAYVPLYVDRAKMTEVVVGHPVVAEGVGGEGLAINVVHLNDNPHHWHVSVNNLMNKETEIHLKKAMDLPDFDFEERTITLKAGEYKVLPLAAK